MKHSPLLYRDTTSCPSLFISLHLLCISLLPCRKKHNSFCSLFQPIRKGIGGSFLFPVSCVPQTAQAQAQWSCSVSEIYVFLQETERSNHHNNHTVLSLSPLSSTNEGLIFISESSAWHSLMPKDETLMKTMWCKRYTGITGRRAPWGSEWQRVWLLLGNNRV